MATTGPFYRYYHPVHDGVPGKNDYLDQEWYRQDNVPRVKLRYVKHSFHCVTRSPPSGIQDPCYQVPYDLGQRARALNSAYERLRKSLGESASLAVTLAEHRQAVSMIAKRATQLFSFVSALKKLKFTRAASILGLTKVPPKVGRSKSLANNYLEFHFGWAPLVKDIGNAVEVLQSALPPFSVQGRGSSEAASFTQFNEPPWQGSYYWYRDRALTKVKMHGWVRINNPNLHLANQLGFTNPALVAWELIPFSFVVGWFVNVENFLSQFTDFVGLDIIQPSTTYLTTSSRDSQYPNYGWVYRAERFSFQRFMGFDKPGLLIPPFEGFSVRRGLAAISLLVQKGFS